MPDHKLHLSRREVVLLAPSVNMPGVAIYNATDILPRARAVKKRPRSDISMITLQHSAGGYFKGINGAIECASMCIRPKGSKLVTGEDGKDHIAFTGRGMAAI